MVGPQQMTPRTTTPQVLGTSKSQYIQDVKCKTWYPSTSHKSSHLHSQLETPRLTSSQRRLRGLCRRVKHATQIAPSSLTDNISIVSRRTQTDCLGRTPIHIAQALRQVLKHIRHVVEPRRQRLGIASAEDLVEHDNVVPRARGALDGRVRLEEEVPVTRLRDTPVDDGAGLWVAGPVGVGFLCRVKSRVVTLTDNDDGEMWEAHFLVRGRIHLRTCLAQRRKFLVDDFVILTLGDAVTV